MDSLKLEATFFEALNYPEYARPNFFIIKQRQSQWHKGIYLNTLAEVYHKCSSWVDIHYRAEKNKNSRLKLEDIEIQIKDITKGDDIGTFNKKKLDQLFSAVEAAFIFDNVEIKYSDIEVLSFVEYALWFIRNEFKIQTKELRVNFRPQTKSYFIYEIIKGDLFFNFPKFKHAVRNLLLSTSSLDNLKIILKKYQTASLEIIDLWNSKISFIEQKANELSNSSYEKVRVEFKADELNHSWWNDSNLFEIYSPKIFSNHTFAVFAAQIANLLAIEIFGGNEVSINPSKIDFIQDFIAGFKKLLFEDESAECIRNLKNNKLLEAPFRNWFDSWFGARHYRTYKETLKGNGHIDLIVENENVGKKIVEFKGWWNPKRKAIINQVYKYLTQFEGDAYIVMINHKKISILENYRAIITNHSNGYVDESWEEIKASETGAPYFKSEHNLGPNKKVVYHFIISLF